MLAEAPAEAFAEALVEAPADELADAAAGTLADALADALVAPADALDEAPALALRVTGGVRGGPTLTLRVIGVPVLTEVPAAGIVPMMVSGSSRLVSSLI